MGDTNRETLIAELKRERDGLQTRCRELRSETSLEYQSRSVWQARSEMLGREYEELENAAGQAIAYIKCQRTSEAIEILMEAIGIGGGIDSTKGSDENMTGAQLEFLNGPTFRGLWASNVSDRGRLWTVTWVHDGEFMETDYDDSPGLALDRAIRAEARDWS